MLNRLFNNQSANTQKSTVSDHSSMLDWTETQKVEQPAVETKKVESDPAFRKFEAVKAAKLAKLEQLKAAKDKAKKVEDFAVQRTNRMKQGIAELEQIKAQSKQVKAHLIEQEAATRKAINANSSVEAAFLKYLEDDANLDFVIEHLNEQKAEEAAANSEVQVSDDVERYVEFFTDLGDQTEQPVAGEAAAVVEERPVPQIKTPEVEEVETPQVQIETKECLACQAQNHVDADECSQCGTPFVARLTVTVPQPPTTSPAEAQFLSGFTKAETTPVED